MWRTGFSQNSNNLSSKGKKFEDQKNEEAEKNREGKEKSNIKSQQTSASER
jgi:hypothetical protein